MTGVVKKNKRTAITHRRPLKILENQKSYIANKGGGIELIKSQGTKIGNGSGHT